jgi:periplasmic protein TonB
LKGSLPLSTAGHALVIGLLLLVPMVMPSRPKLDLSHAVDVVFAPPPPAPAPTPPAAPPPPPQPVVEQPPPPPPPVVEQPPPPPAAEAETPPPPPKPVPKPAPKPRPRPPQPTVERQPEMPLPLPVAPAPAPVAAPPQVASLPPSAPAAPVISSDYRSMLSTWLETHKHYPEEARQRGEEGRAVLRFRVDRMGRVLDYSVVSSTGFGDLDAAVENMMRGATLPPFPPSMPEPEIEVSVAIRFGLAR